MVILLVEDNEDDVVLFRMAFKKANVPARLQIVSDGEEAVAYLQCRGHYANRDVFPPPDFILSDLNMPRRNGFELLEWIRNNEVFKDMVVHIFSASGREEDVERVYALRANTYMLKPSGMEDLVALIHSLVTLHKYICRVKQGVPACG
ncbi:MAG: response regulator [Verrucomicrobia bacterium]|nr:response regulator [Verrucomicrobiota bacterium]